MDLMEATDKEVYDALMALHFKGKMPGIIGRLGDLAEIDMDYDIPVSAACDRLDDIVVDTTATAEACIEYIRENDIGRGTFLILEELEQFREQSNIRIQTPENVLSIYNLVHFPDERFKPIFYYFLRDALIADNVDQAIRLMDDPGQYRIVTYEGDLFNSDGTITGGGVPPSGRMRFKPRNVEDRYQSPTER